MSAAFLEKKLISAAALIRVNSVNFLMHFETKLLVNDKVTVYTEIYQYCFPRIRAAALIYFFLSMIALI